MMGIEQCPISELTDLQEVPHMTYNLTGIPSYRLKFLKEDFLPLYNSKIGPDGKDCKVEKMKAVTSKELCDYFKAKHNKSITTDTLKKTYMNELQNNGLIDSDDSVIDGRQKIFFPIVELENDFF